MNCLMRASNHHHDILKATGTVWVSVILQTSVCGVIGTHTLFKLTLKSQDCVSELLSCLLDGTVFSSLVIFKYSHLEN